MSEVPQWLWLIGAVAFGAVTASVLVLIIWVAQIGKMLALINAKLGCPDHERLKRHSDRLDDLTGRVVALEETAGAVKKIGAALERRKRIREQEARPAE